MKNIATILLALLALTTSAQITGTDTSYERSGTTIIVRQTTTILDDTVLRTLSGVPKDLSDLEITKLLQGKEASSSKMSWQLVSTWPLPDKRFVDSVSVYVLEGNTVEAVTPIQFIGHRNEPLIFWLEIGAALIVIVIVWSRRTWIQSIIAPMLMILSWIAFVFATYMSHNADSPDTQVNISALAFIGTAGVYMLFGWITGRVRKTDSFTIEFCSFLLIGICIQGLMSRQGENDLHITPQSLLGSSVILLLCFGIALGLKVLWQQLRRPRKDGWKMGHSVGGSA